MSTYYVFATVLSESAADHLAIGLVKLGYQVGGAGEKKGLYHGVQGQPLLTTIRADAPAGVTSATGIITHVQQVFQGSIYTCLNVVVQSTSPNYVAWHGAPMVVDTHKAPTPTKQRRKKHLSHLKLVKKQKE